MNKKWLIAVCLVVVIGAISGAGWIFYSKKMIDSDDKQAISAALNPINGQVVGEKMPKTNPFETNINPFDAYKNPFK